MAINAYTGLMGSGKSYEVVSSVIVPALSKGRRVVTNIDGINYENLCAYLLKHYKCDAPGEVVSVKTEDILQPNFFPHDEVVNYETVVKPGDLVCVDEAWKFWDSGSKISDEHMNFFRMHRHFTHPETGVTCDIAFMAQDISDMHRKIKAVVEMTCRTIKLKALGAPTAYRVELYEGHKVIAKSRLDTYIKKYSKEVFPLYKSYAAGSGVEKAIDKRQNILLNKKFWVIGGATVAFIAFAIWNTMRFFSPQSSPFLKQQQQQQHQTPTANATASTTPQNTRTGPANAINADGSTVASQAMPSASANNRAGFSNSWRIVGEYSANGERFVLVAGEGNKLRAESPSMFTGRGLYQSGEIDGERVLRWTGNSSPTLFNQEKRQ